jgi:transitional endoplasmic reticulum ATPase
MHTLSLRNPAIPTLYVKTAPATYSIRSVFQFARRMSPCLLVLEDIETIVTSQTRSYFFNEVDGLENNDGILMVASTNYLNRLDPGLTKRPSRFDRKYLFPLPDEHERKLYAEFWHDKLKNKSNVDFPKKLCAPIAKITNDFSFAYMQEAFVAALLDLARRRTDNLVDIVEVLRLEDGPKDEFDNYVFWRVLKKQVNILRDDMDSGDHGSAESNDAGASQVIDPMQTSTPTLPGTYRDEFPVSLGTVGKMPVFGTGHDKDREREGEYFMARFEKHQFVNSGAFEYRPSDRGLAWSRS